MFNYDCCEICVGKKDICRTATGTIPAEGRTIAVDPNVIPLGSEVLIDGHVYIAEDTGGLIKGNKIDIYLDDHSTGFGKKTAEVFIKEQKE